MSSLFHRAIEWGYRESNPCEGVKRLDVSAGLPSLWKNDPRRAKGIPLSPEVSEMLKEWSGITKSQWVFPSPQDASRPISQPTINEALIYACRRAKIKPTLESKKQAVSKALVTYWSQEAKASKREKVS